MTYEQALEFWFGRINYERTAPQLADLKLDRMRAILERLGNPHERFRIIHVAGSKGKGSTSAMLAAILRAAGYRTGLFTSPHLCHVEERVQVDDVPITRTELADLVAEIAEVTRPGKNGAGRGSVLANLGAPTFFEIATAIGFLHFARRAVDVAVVEVGIGGRFDSTNVCQPLLAVITSISYDHTQLLGSRLASIAMEKAGIIKSGCSAISGARSQEARAIIEAACRERQVLLQQLDVDFHYDFEPGKVRNDTGAGRLMRPARVRVRTSQRDWPDMELSLLGQHQAANAAVAVVCVERLKPLGFQIRDESVGAGLAGVYWPARVEVVGRRPLVILDCAHNVASAQALVETMLASFPPARRLLIFAGSSDKDLRGMLRVLAPHFNHAFLTRFTTNPRSVPLEQLAEMLRSTANLPFTLCPAPADAWGAATAQATPDDLICMAGSVFLAGELRPYLTAKSCPRSGRSEPTRPLTAG
jgi:dihydrofolate synthase/folylpolyglutamate synthase